MRKVQQLLWSLSEAGPASQCRPPLPPVEPELLVRAPRPWVWVLPSHGSSRVRDILCHWRAVRAWVYEHSSSQEPDGPEVRAKFAFEAKDGALTFGRFSGSYDGFHLGLNKDFSQFLERSMRKGGTFTVLHHPDKPWEHCIYGDLDAWLYVPIVELAQRLVAFGSKATRERQALREQLLSVFRSLPQLEYHRLMQGLIGSSVSLKLYDEYALKALEAVESGKASAAALEAVQKQQRGHWGVT